MISNRIAPMTPKSLIELVDNEKTDKNTLHSYLPLYQKLFSPKKDTAQRVLEIGIRDGGSIKLWRDFFSHATIYGLECLDMDKILEELKTDERIVLHTSIDAYSDEFFENHILGKNQESVAEENDGIAVKETVKFDILLDDGPHTLESMIQFILKYSQVMKEDAILVIEDVQCWDWISILKAAVPLYLKPYIRVYDLRRNKGRYDDIVFTIDKSTQK